MMACPSRKLLRSVVVVLCLAGSYLLARQPDGSVLQQYSEQGQRALAEQRYPEAERAFEKLRELDPRTAEVHANLGLVYFEEKKFPQAGRSMASGFEAQAQLAER